MQHTMDAVGTPGHLRAQDHPQPIATPVGKGVDSVGAAKTVDTAGEYTCPMHPQVRQAGPGNCPICGMTLEPVVATAAEGDSPELRDMSRRFWIGLALTAPVFALEMGGHLVNLHSLIAPQTSNWVQLLLGTPVVLWVAGHSLRGHGHP